MQKAVLDVISAPAGHWVGDGFPVRSLFSYDRHGKQISPFLLLDHAGPAAFEPAAQPRGVGQHPHRGFETVTIVYKGEVSHRDSTGQSGTIGPGDVRWMTAAAGILHEEFHSEAFTKAGGTLHMVQLWVNLPASDKLHAPRYQAIVSADIPVKQLAHAAGTVRVIAGNFAGHTGPAKTFSPLQVCDIQLAAGGSTELVLNEGWNTALVVLSGAALVNGKTGAVAGQWASLDPQGTTSAVSSAEGAQMLMLSGQPINEPIAGHGPFVMNTRAEIVQALNDFNSGRFGQSLD